MDFKCVLCHRVFTSNSNLNRHLFDVHRRPDIIHSSRGRKHQNNPSDFDTFSPSKKLKEEDIMKFSSQLTALQDLSPVSKAGSDKDFRNPNRLSAVSISGSDKDFSIPKNILFIPFAEDVTQEDNKLASTEFCQRIETKKGTNDSFEEKDNFSFKCDPQIDMDDISSGKSKSAFQYQERFCQTKINDNTLDGFDNKDHSSTKCDPQINMDDYYSDKSESVSQYQEEFCETGIDDAMENVSTGSFEFMSYQNLAQVIGREQQIEDLPDIPRAAESLFNLIKANGLSPNLYNEILAWARQTTEDKVDFSLKGGFPSYKTVLKKMEASYGKLSGGPPLESKVEMLPQIEEQSLYHFDILKTLEMLYGDPNIIDEDSLWSYNDESTCYGDLNTGTAWREGELRVANALQASSTKLPEGHFYAPQILFIDGTLVDTKGKLDAEVVLIGPGNASLHKRKRPKTWKALGYLPPYPRSQAQKQKEKQRNDTK